MCLPGYPVKSSEWTVQPRLMARSRRGGGLPYKRVGGDHWKFQKEPIRGSKNLFWERGLKCFSPPQEVPILKQHIFSWLIFQPSTIKGNVKAPAVDLLRLSTLRGTKTNFSTPKRYDKHPPSFLYGSSRPPPGGRVHNITLHCVFLSYQLKF